MNKLIPLPLLLLVFGFSAAKAQFTDTTHYHVNLVATGSINRADNGDTYLLNNAFNFAVQEKSVTINTTNSWVYGKTNNTLTNNDLSSALFINLFKTFPHFFYWGLVNYNTSYSLKINNQLLAGVGIAYNIVDNPNARINLSDGVLYDQSDLLVNQIVILNNYNYHTYRNSFRLQYHFAVKDILTVDGSNFLQSAFNNGNDYIIRTTTTLGLKLNKWVNLTTAFTYNRMNITSSNNLIFTYGLTLDKYF
jgi:hypothetical protein